MNDEIIIFRHPFYEAGAVVEYIDTRAIWDRWNMAHLMDRESVLHVRSLPTHQITVLVIALSFWRYAPQWVLI